MIIFVRIVQLKINKSDGVTDTETMLARLCNDTFLNIWYYPNPFNNKGKELCDGIAIYENHVFLFFDRKSNKFENGNNIDIQWQRWVRTVIDKQVNAALGAERYIKNDCNDIYLDAANSVRLPVKISRDNLVVHKIIVAHGANEACKVSSENNIYGSLGIMYTIDKIIEPSPFVVNLKRNEQIHLLDSINLNLVFKELDTFSDFVKFFTEKEKLIQKVDLVYCGEEDLLSEYLNNFNDEHQAHYLCDENTIKNISIVVIPEGSWKHYINSKKYKNKQNANKISYYWDTLIKHIGNHALSGTLLDVGNVFSYDSPIYEMAKESRLNRRIYAAKMIDAIEKFPDNLASGYMRHMIFMSSVELKSKAYVFLQVASSHDITNYALWQLQRGELLKTACCAAKNKFPGLTTIIGIVIDAPKHYRENSESFLMIRDNLRQEDIERYGLINKEFNFFNDTMTIKHETHYQFPM